MQLQRQVVTADYSQDFGYYVVIKHKHGFYTRYAHMSVIRAEKVSLLWRHYRKCRQHRASTAAHSML